MPSLRHLEILRAVIRAGGVNGAARSLHLAPSTVSVQLAGLARSLGTPLLRRRGRGLEPTAAGLAAAEAAGEALEAVARVLAAVDEAGPGVLPVGAAEDVPQAVVASVFAPALAVPRPPRLHLHVDHPARLFDDLAGGGLAAVLADRAPPPELDPHARVHRLTAAAVAFLAAPALARRLGRGFPRLLDGAPILLPEPGDALRRRLDQWFEEARVKPRIAVETDDPELRRRFAVAGAGVLPAPASGAERDGLVRLGLAGGVEERWWLISRRASRDPALAAVLAATRRGA